MPTFEFSETLNPEEPLTADVWRFRTFGVKRRIKMTGTEMRHAYMADTKIFFFKFILRETQSERFMI